MFTKFVRTDHHEKPKIAHIITKLDMGGSQRVALEIVLNPLMQNYRHFLICSNQTPYKAFYEMIKDKNIPIYDCPMYFPIPQIVPSYRVNKALRKSLLFTYRWRLAQLLKRIKPNLVHTHFYMRQHDQGYAALKSVGVPWICTLHGLIGERRYRKELIDVKAILNLIRTNENAYITAVSQAVLDDLLAGEGQIDFQKFRVIYNGANTHVFDHSISRDPRWRHHLGISEDALIFGAAARLVPGKRIDLLIEAAKQIIDRGINAHFMVAGSGILESQLSEIISKKGISDNFHLIGYQSDMQRFLREIDVFVLPTDSEGLPLVLAEAYAMRLPCIATDVGGVSEIISKDVGILVLKDSVDSLVEALLIMCDENNRLRYAANTHKVAKKFNANSMISQYKDLYDKLLLPQEK